MRQLSLFLSLAMAGAAAALPHQLESSSSKANNGIRPSFDVTSCPGYQLVGQPKQSKSGFTAKLNLAGEGCNAYGMDIHNLTLSVVYEKQHQLHVHIYDTDKNQYQLPNGLIFDRPSDDPSKIQDGSTAEKSDLVFHHTAENGTDGSTPWAFWVERRSNGDVIFDTRPDNIPTYQDGMDNVSANTPRNTTATPAHPLVSENQYLQLSSALPRGANIYGLGEYVANSFRRDPDQTLQPFFTLDAGTPVDSNQYGYHPIYTEARRGDDGKLRSHSAYMQNTAGMDVLLRPGLIQYRAIGGTLDLRFFSGDDDDKSNSANAAISQYVNFIGLPTMHPYWSYGLHLCRWGYNNISDTEAIVDAMRAADIPLEVQWNDIDYLQEFRDFTTDPQRFPQKEFAAFVNKLKAKHQHYIPILDAAIPKAPTNASDRYDPGTRGEELDVFIKNRNGTQCIGEVWPGYTTFVDQQAKNAQKWWSEAIANFSDAVPFSGLWLDMNEPSSFVPGNAAGPNTNLSDTPSHQASTSVTGWPQGYDNTTFGNSGNITVDGKLTFQQGVLQNNDAPTQSKRALLFKRDEPTTDEERYGPSDPDYVYYNTSQRYLSNPPYAIHNGIHNSEMTLNLNLDHKTVAMDAVGTQGIEFYDVHNLDGTLQEKHIFNALTKTRPNERPFLISRSTYPGAGKYTGHWLGDNFFLWTILNGEDAYKAGAGMAQSIDGLLQFQMFGMPMVGADACGFNRNSDEELCNRWMMLASFTPNETSVMGLFPNAGGKWRNIFTWEALDVEPSRNVSVPAPLSSINVHLRPAAALLTHSKTEYTTYETQQHPYAMVVNINDQGCAESDFYVDDGVSPPPTANSSLTIKAKNGKLSTQIKGSYNVPKNLASVVVLDLDKPDTVMVANKKWSRFSYDQERRLLNITSLDLDLNKPVEISWS